MNLEDIRKSIDETDDQIKALYLKRMELVKQVADYKKTVDKAVNDPDREKKILLRITENEPEEIQIYLKRVFEALFETSKAYQSTQVNKKSEVVDKIRNALSQGAKDFPLRAKVACQGIEGAYSGIASERLFELADVTYFKNFDAVFAAVESGFCRYGVLPIENSYAGSVNQVYDLMKEHKFYIVKSIRLPINHCLVVKKGVKIEDIK